MAFDGVVFMAQLKKEVKLFIVDSLARFNTPSQTAELVKERFKISITPQRCEGYDPTKRAGQNLSDELRVEFEKAREEFRQNIKDIPIANPAYRLQLLNSFQQRTNEKNIMVQLKIIESARAEIFQLHKIGMDEGDDDDADTLPVKVEVQVKDARKHDRKATSPDSEHSSS